MSDHPRHPHPHQPHQHQHQHHQHLHHDDHERTTIHHQAPPPQQSFSQHDEIPRDGPPPCEASIVTTIPEDPAQAAMYQLLGSRLRCTLTDGRTATGAFICLDRLKNVILMDVIEERYISPADYGATGPTANRRVLVQRELSQAMVPGKHLVKVEVEQAIWDEKVVMKSTTTKVGSTVVS